MSNEALVQSVDTVWDKIHLDQDGLFPNYKESTKLGDWVVLEGTSLKMMLLSEKLNLFLKLFTPNTGVYSQLAHSCLVAFSKMEGLKTPVLSPLLLHKSSLVFPLVSDIDSGNVFDLYTPEDLGSLEFTALKYHMHLAFSTDPRSGLNIVETGNLDHEKKVIDPLNDLPSRLRFFMRS